MLPIILISLAGLGVLVAFLKPKKTQDASVDVSQGETDSAAETSAPINAPVNLNQRIIDLSYAIAQAEGFGIANVIPTMYHNPGDLKPPNGSSNYWNGQTGVGNGGHAIFKSDAAGWDALRKQILLWATNTSNVVGTRNTFLQLAQKYAESWQPWINNVLRFLNNQGYPVNQNSTLGDYFNG